MRRIVYSITIGDDLISQAVVQVTDNIAERLESQEDVRLKISIIPEKDENKE